MLRRDQAGAPVRRPTARSLARLNQQQRMLRCEPPRPAGAGQSVGTRPNSAARAIAPDATKCGLSRSPTHDCTHRSATQGRQRRSGCGRNRRLARLAWIAPPQRRCRARALHPGCARSAREGARRSAGLSAVFALSQFYSARAAEALPRRHRDRDPPDGDHSLERARDGGPCQQGLWGARRARRQLRLGRGDFRSRFQSFLSRVKLRVGGRLGVFPAAFVPRSLCTSVSRRPTVGRKSEAVSPGTERPRSVVLSASLADAGVLAGAVGVDGPWANQRDLPGAVHEVSAASRPGADGWSSRLGCVRRRRDGRAGIDRRARPGGAGKSRQPHLRRQLQPAAPGWAGPRQRAGDSGTRITFPGRRLERNQGAVGIGLGRYLRAR
ncbi:hypothetical protein ABIF75_006980 [Bradyrhizobium japonicum]